MACLHNGSCKSDFRLVSKMHFVFAGLRSLDIQRNDLVSKPSGIGDISDMQALAWLKDTSVVSQNYLGRIRSATLPTFACSHMQPMTRKGRQLSSSDVLSLGWDKGGVNVRSQTHVTPLMSLKLVILCKYLVHLSPHTHPLLQSSAVVTHVAVPQKLWILLFKLQTERFFFFFFLLHMESHLYPSGWRCFGTRLHSCTPT